MRDLFFLLLLEKVSIGTSTRGERKCFAICGVITVENMPGRPLYPYYRVQLFFLGTPLLLHLPLIAKECPNTMNLNHSHRHYRHLHHQQHRPLQARHNACLLARRHDFLRNIGHRRGVVAVRVPVTGVDAAVIIPRQPRAWEVDDKRRLRTCRHPPLFPKADPIFLVEERDPNLDRPVPNGILIGMDA